MILYHYTSNENFISIIKGKKLHLSSLNHSNDTQEGMQFFEHVKGILFEKLRCRDQEIFEFHVKNFCEDEGAFGFCLSEEKDLLSQWVSYASDGGGVAIGFNKEKLDRLLVEPPEDRQGLQLKKVDYSQSIEEKLSLDDIANLAMKHELIFQINTEKMSADELLLGSTNPVNNSANDYLGLIQKISPYRYVFKNPTFAAEKEWRLYCHNSNILLWFEFELDFKAKNNLIIPFREFPSFNLPNDIIDEVILGPNNKTPDYIIEAMLLQSGFEKVKIRNSESTYR
jgi:hypothetical protein